MTFHIEAATAGSPVANLSLSDPRCNSDACLAFKQAHALSQLQTPGALQYRYGHWVAWYYVATIGFFAALHGLRLWKSRRSAVDRSEGRALRTPGLLDKARACRRFVSYRRLQGRYLGRLGLPSAGMSLLLSAGIVYFVVLAFAVTPYVRVRRGFGAPPFTLRTGMMMAACIPLIIALSGKANLLTALTGLGHEKLNVVHRYVAWLVAVTSVAHTINAIVAALIDGGYEGLTRQFYKDGAHEFAGAPTFAILFAVVVCSLPWVRHRMYETFWHLHIVLVLALIGLIFWHANNTVDSWYYLYAAVALLVLSTLTRIFYFNRRFNLLNWGQSGSKMSVVPLSDGAVRLDVVAPRKFGWRPGQHCYLRLPSLRPWDNHPFTIANAAGPAHSDDPNTVAFIVRPRTGFTLALQQFAASLPDRTVTAWLDGPYGGYSYRLERMYDQLILVAGGIGVTACLPWLDQLRMLAASGAAHVRLQSVTLIWIVHQRSHVQWAEREIEKAKGLHNGFRIKVDIFVTNHNEEIEEGQDTTAEKKAAGTTVLSMSSNDSAENLHGFSYGKPDLKDLLPRTFGVGKTMVIACGPQSLKTDVSNACAKAQNRVLRGESREIKLYTETFGW